MRRTLTTVIIIVAIIVGGFYFIKQLTNKNPDGPAKCAEQSKIFFDNYKYGVPDLTYGYRNHYNSKQNKCYILIRGTGAGGLDNIIWDVYENKSIAQCEYYYADETMNFCGYPGSSEKYDINKFDNYIKPLMED